MHAPGRTAIIFGIPAQSPVHINNGRLVDLIELLPMGKGRVSLHPEYPPAGVFIKEPTWVVEGHESLTCPVTASDGRSFTIEVPCLPIPQRNLLIIGDKDGNPVSEYHDKPIEKIEEPA